MYFKVNARRFLSADQTANACRFPNNIQASSITDFMLPYKPEECVNEDNLEKFGHISCISDAKFFINTHNNCKYLTFEYERELDERRGSQYLMVYGFYVKSIGRTYRFYLETPGDEHYPLYILELTYLPLVYTMDTESRAYMIEFAKHNMEHNTDALN